MEKIVWYASSFASFLSRPIHSPTTSILSSLKIEDFNVDLSLSYWQVEALYPLQQKLALNLPIATKTCFEQAQTTKQLELVICAHNKCSRQSNALGRNSLN